MPNYIIRKPSVCFGRWRFTKDLAV